MERHDVSWDSQNRSKEKEKPIVHSLYIWLSLQIPETCGEKKKKKPHPLHCHRMGQNVLHHIPSQGHGEETAAVHPGQDASPAAPRSVGSFDKSYPRAQYIGQVSQRKITKAADTSIVPCVSMPAISQIF